MFNAQKQNFAQRATYAHNFCRVSFKSTFQLVFLTNLWHECVQDDAS